MCVYHNGVKKRLALLLALAMLALSLCGCGKAGPLSLIHIQMCIRDSLYAL